jgi:hypothetical protein
VSDYLCKPSPTYSALLTTAAISHAREILKNLEGPGNQDLRTALEKIFEPWKTCRSPTPVYQTLWLRGWAGLGDRAAFGVAWLASLGC